MPGPQRKPTQHLLLADAQRGKERARTEPKLGFAIPDMPPTLTDKAREFWPYCCDQVASLRCTTSADAVQLGIMAECLADIANCDEEIRTYGPTVVSEKGGYYSHPACGRKNTAIKTLQACLDRFGMNPTNRSKVAELAPKLAEIVDVSPAKRSRYEE